MKVAVFHNRYTLRGGEDEVVDLEIDLLRKAGCEVHPFFVESGEVSGLAGRVRAGFSARWNGSMVDRVAGFMAEHPVDVAHVHNIFPLLSPSVHATLKTLGIPVVQTLHNYRLACANGVFLRDGRACEDCVGRGPWNAVRHGCYRGSRIQTAVWASATTHHRRLGVWQDLVDLFVAPSEFLMRKLCAVGLPAARIAIKPNPVHDPGPPVAPGRGAVYAGRLSQEKGVGLLLDAWRELPDVPLTIIGAGPEESRLRGLAAGLDNVQLTGALPRDAVAVEIARAAFAVAPSRCYENFPLFVAEAMAAGRPVVVSSPTAMTEMIDEGRTGLHFAAGDARALAAACRRLAAEPSVAAEMGREARADFEDRFAPERSTQRLLGFYRELSR